MMVNMHKGQAVWWKPKTIMFDWQELFPKKEDLAVTIVSIDSKNKTAIVEYLDIRRQPIRYTASLNELRSRMLR